VIASALNLEVGVATYRDPDGTKGKKTPHPTQALLPAVPAAWLLLRWYRPLRDKGHRRLRRGPYYAASFVAEFVADVLKGSVRTPSKYLLSLSRRTDRPRRCNIATCIPRTIPITGSGSPSRTSS
jgi:hypothetical protein